MADPPPPSLPIWFALRTPAMAAALSAFRQANAVWWVSSRRAAESRSDQSSARYGKGWQLSSPSRGRFPTNGLYQNRNTNRPRKESF